MMSSPHLLLQSSPGFHTNTTLPYLPKSSSPTPKPSLKTLSSHLTSTKFPSLPLESPHPIQRFNGKITKYQVQNLINTIKNSPFQDPIDYILQNSKIQTISDFNEILTALFIANQSTLALKLFSEISKHGFPLNSCTFSVILRCHLKKNDLDEAERVLHQMLDNGLIPNVATFTTLIHSFCKKGKLQKAFRVFDSMSKYKCDPNVQTYNCLVKGLCYVGRVEEAFELVQNMKTSAVKLDIYTYTAMMDGFCKVGRSDEAMELLNEAIEIGLKPNVVTFNTLFHGYTKEGRPLEGINVLKRMKLGNVMPDCVSYSTLIHGLLIWKKTRAALRVCNEMVEIGCEVDERLSNSLLRGLCGKFMKHNVMLEDAYQVFDKMRNRGCVIDYSSYNLVFEALSIAKKFEDALVVLEEIVGVDEYFPRLSSVNRLIRGFCMEGKVEKAVLVLGIIDGSHKMPNRMSYELIIQEFNRQGRFLEACIVYGVALVRGTIPNNMPQQQLG
ncbi:hypothetical protein M5689_009567 [Euphorbia peplus]|nr:hypothetical protein M5689_009567 [Euphorbia peplus]